MPLESKPFEVPMAAAVNRVFGLIAPGFDLYDLQTFDFIEALPL